MPWWRIFFFQLGEKGKPITVYGWSAGWFFPVKSRWTHVCIVQELSYDVKSRKTIDLRLQGVVGEVFLWWAIKKSILRRLRSGRGFLQCLTVVKPMSEPLHRTKSSLLLDFPIWYDICAYGRFFLLGSRRRDQMISCLNRKKGIFPVENRVNSMTACGAERIFFLKGCKIYDSMFMLYGRIFPGEKPRGRWG